MRTPRGVRSHLTLRRISLNAFLLTTVVVATTVDHAVDAAAALRSAAGTASSSVSLRMGTLVPNSLVPLDLAFSSALRGYELIQNASGTHVAATTNGGSTWQVTSAPIVSSPPLPATRSGPQFPSVATTPALGVAKSGTVYAYGVSASVVDVSANEGRSWQRVSLPGTVEDITSNGPTLTALVDGPQLATGPGGHLPAPPPSGWLYSSDDGGRRWNRVSTLPDDLGPYKVLVEPTTTTMYALAPGENNTNDGVYGGLARSTDGGRSWTEVAQPCDIDAAPRFGSGAEFGATSAEALWIVCGDGDGDGPGAITQVLRTTDGGEHWSLVAGTAEIEPWNHTNFPATSSLPPASPAATSLFEQNSAWLVLAKPSVLLRTTDGGRTWTAGASRDVEMQGPRLVLDVDGTIEVRTTTELWQFHAGLWHVAGYTGKDESRK